MRRAIRVTLDKLGHVSSLSVDIDYEYEPRETSRHIDGRLHRGHPQNATILRVTVYLWRVGDETRLRMGCTSDVWKSLDVIAADIVDWFRHHYRRLCLDDARDYLESQKELFRHDRD